MINVVKKKETIILIIGAVLLIAAYFYIDTSDSLFGQVVDLVAPVDWNEVHPRNIVKNAIPLELLETNGNNCKVKANDFWAIVSHNYFVKSNELMQKLQFDNGTKTLIVPCDELDKDNYMLHVWYAVEEAPQHALKYEYFFTPLNVNITAASPP